MKCVTSYFNTTVFRKHLTRYWPVWALYTLIWLYALPINCMMAVTQNQLWRGTSPAAQVRSFINDVPDMLEGFGLGMAFVFGILAAMSVFSYLYNNRAAGMFHSLPVRRETLFITGYLAGLSFLLLPNVLVCLLTLGAELLCGGTADLYTALLWLLAQSAMCLFFYSFAVCCAMFTGHLLALPAFYGIFSFLASIAIALFEVVLEPYLFGFSGLTDATMDVVWWLTPVIRLADALRWRNKGNNVYVFEGTTELIVYAVVGVLLAGLALLIYRKRHIESAGDVVSVSGLRPVFKYGVALFCGLCFGYWLYAMFGFDALGGFTGSLLLWTFIGYFVAEMLLKKSFRVWKAWKGCAVLLVLVAAGLFSLRTGAFGYIDRVPAPSAIASVQVDGMGSYPYDEGRNFEFDTEDPHLIQNITALHRAIVDEHNAPWSGDRSDQEYIRLNIAYTLTNGSVLRRHYGTQVAKDSPLAEAARTFYCDPAVAELAYDLDRIDPADLVSAEIVNLWNPITKNNIYYDFREKNTAIQRQEALTTLYAAVLADFEAGDLGERYLFDLEEARQLNTCSTDLVLYWDGPPVRDEGEPQPADHYETVTRSITVTLSPNARNTIRVLTELGVLNENTTLRLYRDIVDEENRTKLIYGEVPYVNLNPNSADIAIIGGADGPTSIVVAEAN